MKLQLGVGDVVRHGDEDHVVIGVSGGTVITNLGAELQLVNIRQEDIRQVASADCQADLRYVEITAAGRQLLGDYGLEVPV